MTCTPCHYCCLECNWELIKLPWQACCVTTAATAKAFRFLPEKYNRKINTQGSRRREGGGGGGVAGEAHTNGGICGSHNTQNLERADRLQGLVERACTTAGNIQAQQREAVHNSNADVLITTALLAEIHMAHLLIRLCQILCGKLRQL